MFEETIYNVTYPLYATYMKLFGLLLTTILMVTSSSCHSRHTKEQEVEENQQHIDHQPADY